MSRRSWSLLLLLAATAGAALAWRPVADWRAARATAQAFADVSACLLGEPGYAVTAPAQRLRRVQIGASVDKTHSAWPQRCEPFVLQLQRGVAGQLNQLQRCDGACCKEDARCPLLRDMREEVARLSAYVRGEDDVLFDPDQLYGLAAPLALDAAAPNDVPAAPPPPPLLDPERVSPLYKGNYLRLLTDPAGDATLELLFYEQHERYAHCEIDLRAEATTSCRELPSGIPVGLAGELFAAESGAPARMFAQEGDDAPEARALYDLASGDKLTTVRTRPAGGFVWRDGSYGRIGFEPPLMGKAFHLVRQSKGDASVRLEVGANTSAGPRFLWDEVVWTRHLGDGRHRVFARRASSSDDALGDVLELGTTAPLIGKPSFDICRTEESLVMLVEGKRTLEAATATIFFRSARGWHEPLLMRTGTGRYGLTCQDDSATLSWVRAVDEQVDPGAARLDGADDDRAPVTGRYAVHRVRCTPAKCEHDTATVSLRRYSRKSRYVAGDVGNAMILLWRSPLGDVRMRVAPIERLPTSRDIPVFDDIEHDGFGWDLERDPIFGRAGAVVVLLSRQVGTSVQSSTYAIRIDASGRVIPLQG